MTSVQTQLVPRSALYSSIKQAGFCFAASASVQAWLLSQSAGALNDWHDFVKSWDDMPLDPYMADGGRYRRRRHATLSAVDANIVLEAHQPHYQSLDYNSLNGGVSREFLPIDSGVMQGATMQNILRFCRHTFSHLVPNTPWHIECHQFRIEANSSEYGKPTPEGVHRDGVDFVLVMMVRRQNISSGTTTMHDLELKKLDSFTLTQPLDCAIVNDHRCMHGVTPIKPIDPSLPAYRDVLVVTFRAKK